MGHSIKEMPKIKNEEECMSEADRWIHPERESIFGISCETRVRYERLFQIRDSIPLRTGFQHSKVDGMVSRE
jgi:hypothetical protein